MNYIHSSVAILGITTSVLSGIPVAVLAAQSPQTRIQQTNYQEYYNQGVQKFEQGNFNGAIEDFSRVVQLNPKYYEGFCLRGLAKSQLGDFKAAVIDFDQALRLNPNHTDAYNSKRQWGTVHED